MRFWRAKHARPERGAAAEPGVGAARGGSAGARGIAVQAPTNSTTRTGSADRRRRGGRSAARAEHLVAECRGLAELDRRDRVGAGRRPSPPSIARTRPASPRSACTAGFWSAQAR